MSHHKSKKDIKKLYFKPLMELVEQSHSIHKKHFKANLIQASKLLSIKTGACPEDCAEFYPKIISTRTYQNRLDTLKNVRQAGLTICTGGILGLGESHEDRCSFIEQLSLINPPPESITINTLIPIKGTPLENQKPVSVLDLLRIISVCRILMPRSMIRLSAGRRNKSPSKQFMCFYAGANSIFIGNKLLTADNPELNRDHDMLKSLGLRIKSQSENMSFHAEI